MQILGGIILHAILLQRTRRQLATRTTSDQEYKNLFIHVCSIKMICDKNSQKVCLSVGQLIAIYLMSNTSPPSSKCSSGNDKRTRECKMRAVPLWRIFWASDDGLICYGRLMETSLLMMNVGLRLLYSTKYIRSLNTTDGYGLKLPELTSNLLFVHEYGLNSIVHSLYPMKQRRVCKRTGLLSEFRRFLEGYCAMWTIRNKHQLWSSRPAAQAKLLNIQHPVPLHTKYTDIYTTL